MVAMAIFFWYRILSLFAFYMRLIGQRVCIMKLLCSACSPTVLVSNCGALAGLDKSTPMDNVCEFIQVTFVLASSYYLKPAVEKA